MSQYRLGTDMDPLLAGDYEPSEYNQPETGALTDGMKGDCDICGEPYDQTSSRPSMNEVGEFWDPEKNDSVVAHAQCGIDAGLELA